MPDFLTFNDINRFQAERVLSESEIRKSFEVEGKNIFLSYSSKDKAYLSGVITLLENHGSSVYIDDGDSRLPKKPSQKTAAILRDTIQKLRRFVLFVTTNSKDSIWIPWELGLGDAYKRIPNVALLPTAEKTYQQEWADQEYLGLYRRIVWNTFKGEQKPCWMVYDHIENSGIRLRDWIEGY